MSSIQDYDKKDHTDYAEIPMENDGNDTTVEDNGDEYEVIKYSCDMCAYENQKLQSHLIRHGEARSFQCKVCKKTYKHASTLTKHTNSHGVNYPCNKCNKKYTYQDQLKRHKALKHEEGHIKMHHCEYCAYKSFRADVLRNHMSAKHPHA